MAIAHAISGEVLDLLAPGQPDTADKTIAIFKAPDLEVMRLVLPAGKRMPDHSVSPSTHQSIKIYGFDRWTDLFTNRQLVELWLVEVRHAGLARSGRNRGHVSGDFPRHSPDGAARSWSNREIRSPKDRYELPLRV